MTEDNYIKVLKCIALLTDPKNCWMIGSSSLILLSHGLSGKKYQKFKVDNFKLRDIDLIQTSGYNVVNELLKIGSMTLLKTVKTEYGSIMLNERRIESIETYSFKIGCGNNNFSKMIKCLSNNINIDISIDIITISNDFSIKEVVSEWPITETKRNFAIFQDGINNISFTELKNVKNYIKINNNLLCNTIETLKHLNHYYGSPIRGYCQTGDKIEREKYSPRNLSIDDNITGKYKRLMDVLNGRSIELIKPIKIRSYYYDELPTNNKDEDKCMICLTPIKDVSNKLFLLKCGHVYCLGCLCPMLIGYLILRHNRLNNTSSSNEGDIHGNKCPICRRDIFEINDRNLIFNNKLMSNDCTISFINI